MPLGILPAPLRGEMAPWAEMLSKIGHKNSRLYQVISREFQPPAESGDGKAARAVVLEELERERSRIARELHAGAGQPLAGIKLNLEMLDRCAAVMPPAGREALARLQFLAAQALDQVRAVSHRLHPPEWQLLSVEDAIRRLVESSGLRERFQTHLEIPDLPVQPSHSAKIALYRCAQECISNVVRHSGATVIRIALRVNAAALELSVADNGHGFGRDQPAGSGIGLAALKEHSEALGGACSFASGPAGVTVTVRIPLADD